MKELKVKRARIAEDVYGIADHEFERIVKLLEKQGYVQRVLRVGDNMSLRPARLTEKGEAFLAEHSELAEEYPDSIHALKEWVLADKIKYSNDAVVAANCPEFAVVL